GPLRARRANGKGIVVERDADRIVEPLQWTDGRERPRVYRDVRRRAVLLRRCEAIDRLPLIVSCSPPMPKNTRFSIAAASLAIAMLLATAYGQVGRGGSQWLTARGDAQRTSWIRTDALISVQALSKPGFQLQWKTALENPNRASYGLGGGVSA